MGRRVLVGKPERVLGAGAHGHEFDPRRHRSLAVVLAIAHVERARRGAAQHRRDGLEAAGAGLGLGHVLVAEDPVEQLRRQPSLLQPLREPQPLEMLGLMLGEAKILRTPGGHVTEDALNGCILGVNLLRVDRILVVAHTRCAMADCDDAEMRRRVAEASGRDASGLSVGATPDQEGKLRADVKLLSEHPLIEGRARIGGFLYDVDTGLLGRVC